MEEKTVPFSMAECQTALGSIAVLVVVANLLQYSFLSKFHFLQNVFFYS